MLSTTMVSISIRKVFMQEATLTDLESYFSTNRNTLLKMVCDFFQKSSGTDYEERFMTFNKKLKQNEKALNSLDK